MKQILLAITILLALASQGQSQALTKKEKIKTLFAIMHTDSLIIKSMDGMAASMVNNMTPMLNDTAYRNEEKAKIRTNTNRRLIWFRKQAELIAYAAQPETAC